MLNEKRSLLRLVFFFFAALLAVTKLTDADLLDEEVVPNNFFEATTLDFSNKDTANDTDKTLFFNIFGLLPQGFQVESLRVKKEGNLDFNYQISTENVTGSGSLCQALTVVVMKNWQEQYRGPLTSLSYQGSVEGDVGWQDLVFVVSLDVADSSLMNQTCSFNTVVRTISDPETGPIFYDEEILQNQITTGIWL